MDISESDLLVGHEYKVRVREGYIVIAYDGKHYLAKEETRHGAFMKMSKLEVLVERLNKKFALKGEDRLERGE
jgi:hypothetical protein